MSASKASFYVTGGTLRHDAPSYVERQADRDVFEGLLGGEFCYVLTPRQIGKSSLMVRTASALRDQGVNVLALDLTAIGQNLTPEQWYDGLVAQMGRQLRLDEDLDRFWRGHERLGPCQRFFAAIRDVVLQRRSGALAIFVDEIDAVRSLPFSTDEFFAAIRECYNRRAEDPELNRVSFCLLGVATPSDLIQDMRTTPFNIGRRIELHDFTRAEAAPLAQGLKWLPRAGNGSSAASDADEAMAALTAERLLTRILFWTGGHPYLTQRFCRAVADGATVVDPGGVDRVCAELFLSSQARERDDNLLFVRERLLRSDTDLASLLELYRRVLRGKTVLDDETSELVSVLRLSGIVKALDGRLRERNRIYAQAFNEDWIKAHMPDAELRRQKEAFQRGVFGATAIAAVVVAALTVAVVLVWNQTTKGRRALAQAYFSQARAGRVKGLAGQRYESLNALNQARPHYTNVATLRDEALACLALVDFREITNGINGIKEAKLVELSPDLEVWAGVDHRGDIALRRVRDGQSLATLPGSNLPIERLRFGPKDSVLVAEYHGPSGSQLVVWDWEKKQQLFTTAHGINGNALDFSADGRRLAAGQPDGRIIVFSLPHGEIVHTLELKLHSGAARVAQAIRFNPAGDLLAACSNDDQYVEIWNPSTTQRVARLYHADVVHDLSWHPQGQLLAAACRDSRVYLWQTNDVETPKKLTGHEGPVTAVAFNHRGTLLASRANDETVRLWIPATGRQMVGRKTGEGFDRLQFNANDRRLIAAGRGQVKTCVWEVLGDELTVLQVEGGRGSNLRTIDFSPDSRWLLAASGKQITFWDADSGRELGAIPLRNARGAWFASDSRHLVAGGDRGLFMWPLLYGESVSTPRIESGVKQQLSWVWGEAGMKSGFEWVGRSKQASKQVDLDDLGMMAVSRDRTTAAVFHIVKNRKTGLIRNELLLATLEPEGEMSVRTNLLGIFSPQLALHPNVAWLATRAGDSNTLRLWNLAEQAGDSIPCVIPGSEHFSFSPDGNWLATCWEGKFRFYRVGAWKEPVFAVQRSIVSDQHAPVAFSWDGRTVALASSRYSIQLRKLPQFDRSEAELIATLESPDRLPLEILAFSRDGRRLAAATDGQIVQLWNLASLRDGLAALNLNRDWPE